jgi:hypothetical protein
MAFEKIFEPPEAALALQVRLDTMLLRLFSGPKSHNPRRLNCCRIMIGGESATRN